MYKVPISTALTLPSGAQLEPGVYAIKFFFDEFIEHAKLNKINLQRHIEKEVQVQEYASSVFK